MGRGCYIWDILVNIILWIIIIILLIVVIFIVIFFFKFKIKGLEFNLCMIVFRELIFLNILFWMEKKLFWEKNDKILYWLVILNEDERKICWNLGLIF